MTSCLFQSTHKITPNLYLGDAKIARSKYFLENNNIHGIINATTNEPNAYPESYDYLRVNIDDKSSEQIRPFFQHVFEFIRRHHSLGHSVLVHCQMGISRSATLVIAYLMTDGHKTLGEAFQQVKSVRQQIDPNEGFIRQLRELEISLFGRTMTLERITFLDLSIEELPKVVMDHVIMVLEDFVAAFADDASLQTLDTLKDQLLRLADKVKRDHVTDLLSNGICKCLRMFGDDDPLDQQARIGLQQGLSALCTFYNVDINDCLDNLTNTKEWKDLCIDVPLVNRWINHLRDQSSSIDTS
jgi:protein phosphatase slingshot